MNTNLIIAGTLFYISLTCLTLQSCVFSDGNFGPRLEEERNVGNFTALKVTSGIDVTLRQGNRAEVIIIAGENNMDDVKSDVIDNELRLSVDGNWFHSNHVEAWITFVDLESLDISAGSDVESESLLKLGNIRIEASSGSDLKLTLEANEVELRASSGSDASLTGSARSLTAKASSGSDINAYDFEVENAVLELSSGSDVKAWVTGSLEVDASSGSDVYYKGDPDLLNIDTSGGSDVNKR
ncbi:MAG: DUF2807 domain-containing protein [Cyclobacteriaceae bacterium]|nr:DUF2807 domain-containing protein [Cyclobacteriaceae bacterium]